MKKIGKKTVALILALTMALSLMSVTAWARYGGEANDDFGIALSESGADVKELSAGEDNDASYGGSIALSENVTTGQIGDNVWYFFDADTGELTISGSGATRDYDYSGNYSPFDDFGTLSHGITNVSVEEGVTYLGNYLFADCQNLVYIDLPESLTGLGSCVFYNFIDLTVLFRGHAPTLASDVFHSGTRGTITVYYPGGSDGTWDYFITGNFEFMGTVNWQSYGSCDHENLISHEAEAKEATCTEDGAIAYWECPDCGRYFSDAACTERIKEDEWILPVKNHNYSREKDEDGKCLYVTFDWTGTDDAKHLDDITCTAVHHCTDCDAVSEPVDCDIYHYTGGDIKASCTESERYEMVAYATITNPRNKETINAWETEYVKGESAYGHNYDPDSVTLTWSGLDDAEQISDIRCTAAFACLDCDHIEEVDCDMEYVPKSVGESSCTAAIDYDLTASAKIVNPRDGETLTVKGEKYVEGVAVGHSWSEPVFAWATDYGSAAVTFTCAVCGETETLDAEVSAEEIDATCTADAYTLYTASVTPNGVTYTDGRSIVKVGSALGHAWDEGTVTLEPTETEEGELTYTCTVCGETETVAIPALGFATGGEEGDADLPDDDEGSETGEEPDTGDEDEDSETGKEHGTGDEDEDSETDDDEQGGSDAGAGDADDDKNDSETGENEQSGSDSGTCDTDTDGDEGTETGNDEQGGSDNETGSTGGSAIEMGGDNANSGGSIVIVGEADNETGDDEQNGSDDSGSTGGTAIELGDDDANNSGSIVIAGEAEDEGKEVEADDSGKENPDTDDAQMPYLMLTLFLLAVCGFAVLFVYDLRRRSSVRRR